MPKTVLLADDSVTIQHAVGISLANEDIALINVNNGEDAIIKARAIKPDLVLLDVVMPKMSGYDVCKQIRQDPSIKHTPVIMLIGAIEGFDENKFKEAMANDYIIKPFESGALINKVRKYLYPELSRPVATQPAYKPVQTPEPPKVQIPQIPVQPQPVARTSPQIPVIPPKPAVPPIVPPVIPSTPQPPISTQAPIAPEQKDSVPFVSPPVPPQPPHIPQQATQQPESPQKSAPPVTDFVNNLISPVLESTKAKVVEQEPVDEISPQEIEEITSDIANIVSKPQLEEKIKESVSSVIDLVSQVDQSITPPRPEDSSAPKEEPAFNMEQWGAELKKEIMEASGLSKSESEIKTPSVIVSEPPAEERKAQPEVQIRSTYSPVEAEPTPMQVVPIADSITTEPVGEGVKPVDVPPEPPVPAQIEPTSLVEPKISLPQNLDPETMKYIRDTIEKVVWEVVPELAEKLIKAEIKRLMSEKEE